MVLSLSELYHVTGTEKVQDLEHDLKKDLEELRQEIEDFEPVPGTGIPRAISSIQLPKDAVHFKMERKVVVDRALQVSEAHPLKNQADLMREEMLNSEALEYTPASLPLLLHQHFVDRIHHLAQSKFLHMLRWKRFCENTSAIETLYPLYQARLGHILQEYNDCVQRAQRLSIAREAFLCNNDTAISSVQGEDLLIYLRWLVCHLHSVKKFNQYLRLLQWLPVLHKDELTMPTREGDPEDTSTTSRMASRYQDDVAGIFQRPRSGMSRPSSAASPRNQTPLPQPPAINPTLLSTTPMPSSALSYAAAASGGGLATDEDTLGIPLNMIDFQSLKPHLNYLLNIYGINYNLDSVQNTADEMEMFAAVNRKFKQIFMRQEHMKTFKTYDRIEIGQENWGSDTPIHALRKESNWRPYTKLKPEMDENQQKHWTQLRQFNNTDEILKMQARFLDVSDPDQVQAILQEHASCVRNPPVIQPTRVTTHLVSNTSNTMAVFRKIYSNVDKYTDSENTDSVAVVDIDERDIENVSFSSKSRSGSARKRKDSYDYINTVQMLGLDEGEQNHNDPASVQGAYMSFLQLRHLRLRDLQRSCLGMLNYYRSLERTLTINDAGLTQDGEDFRQTSPQNHRRGTENDGNVGGGGGLGSHAYVHNTPADFKLNETDYMEFGDVDNHDDFYTIDDGRVHVQDQRGYYIVYDAAEEDLKKLEQDLMLVATHYIEKDRRDLRAISKIHKPTDSARMRQQSAGDFEIPRYAKQEVDRFGVLLDLWANETAYLECKRELLDCYIEAYSHVFDRDEKRALALVIIDIMYRRPRYDFAANYFIKTYRAECVIMRQHVNLIKSILNKQIDDEREYNQRVCRDGDNQFGLPYGIIPKQPIAVNLSKSALKNVFILEFHPSLAIASKITEALKHALKEQQLMHKPESVLESLMMEKKLYELALQEWTGMENMGTSYSPQVQKDLFSDVFVEDPLFLCEIAASRLTDDSEGDGAKRVSPKEKNITMIKNISRVMESVTLRHRLIDAAWETELLAKMYKKLAAEMGFDEFHMYLRFVQMEFAGYKEDAGRPPPTFITSVMEDESIVDRFIPGFLYLAIQELDEGHVARFSFRSRDGVLQVLRPGGMESLQVILKAQIVQKNALTCAVQQAVACQPSKKLAEWKNSGRNSPTETKSEKSSLTQLTGMSSSTAGTALQAKLQSESSGTIRKQSPEAFISIQLEKIPSRDLMLNEFVTKKTQMGTILRNAEEMERLKRGIISDFCYKFHQRMAQYSLRGQLLNYYNSILRQLEEFPSVRDTYFMMGEAHEKKSNLDDVEGNIPDPRALRKRPRRVLSADGKHVLNIWFIPHHTEVLIMFKTLEDDQCVNALSYCLMIVSALHDMLQYLCAHSKLGSSHARLGSRKMEFVSADWGGTEGIGSELREIQKQIDNLSDPQDAGGLTEFLTLRRDVMFLEFDTAVRHCMADTFLSTGNVKAYKSIVNNIHHALPALSNVQRPGVFSTYLPVPEPLEPRDMRAKEIFPWRAFIGRNGPYPIMFWQCHMIENNIQLCLAGLRDVDRHVAHGEILGVTLLMEDVLQTGYQDVALLAENVIGESDKTQKKDKKPRSGSGKVELKRASSATGSSSKLATTVSLSRTQEPVKAYKLLKFFLLLWKCLEYLKFDWGKRKLGKESIETTTVYRDYCKVYKTEVLLPTLQSVARRLGQGEMYEGIALDTDPLVMPKGASEIEVRAKQVVKLLENSECHMITELRKKLVKELTLVVAERGREETGNPGDLWKRPVMKDSYIIAKPHMADKFTEKLMGDCSEEGETVTFSKKHFQDCMAELGRNIMGREKSNFESYTMYYENLLRTHHQNLYQREQEIKQMRDQLKTQQTNAMVEVQCQLANQGHDLIMEITALRAKVAEMRNQSMTQQSDIRERVKKEYEDLVQNLFQSSFHLKNKFDEFRNELHDDVYEKVSETRREAFEAMSKVKQKYGNTTDDGSLDRTLAKSENLRELQHENHTLGMLVLKMKALKIWRQNQDTANYKKTIHELQGDVEGNKKLCEAMKMDAEEQVILLRQQIVALRKALADAQKEANEVKKLLDRELKEKLEKSHEAMQKARSQRQLEQAKQANIEKLLEELQDKESQLQYLAEENDKNYRAQTELQEKVKKTTEVSKKQLTHERSMKLDAFQRVDDLQAMVYDYETCVSRSQSMMTYSPATPNTGKSRSRAQSAHRSLPPSRGTPSSGFPHPVIWPSNRTITPDMGHLNNEPSKKIQRPKTVGGRLRSRIAEQLLNELEFDERQTIVQLEELQLEGKQVNY